MAGKGKQADKRPPSTTEAKQDEEEEEGFDLVAFQASLDQSVNEARLLVDSWIPQGYGSTSNTADSVQSLKDRARPPRMGLGANPTAIHKQQAEDRKLKERLLGKGRNGSLGDDGSTVKGNDAKQTGFEGDGGAASESDSDEEDSRSRVIGKGKGKLETPTVTNGTKQAANNPFVTKKNVNSTPQKPSTPALFNDPSPSKPSPAKSLPADSTSTVDPTKPTPSATKKIAPLSFYASASKTAPSEAAGLSKNQRKKLRKLEREKEIKEKLQAESRKEEEMERNGGLKRSREEEADEKEDEIEKGDEDVEMQTEDIEGVDKTDTAGQNGNDTHKKKKKKRKGKGKGAAGDSSTAATPLLNL